MTKSCCTCPECRATIRATILDVFDRQRRWMGPWTIVAEDRSELLRTVPVKLYEEILREMVCADDGPLILSDGRREPFPRLLPARLMARPSPMTWEVMP